MDLPKRGLLYTEYTNKLCSFAQRSVQKACLQNHKQWTDNYFTFFLYKGIHLYRNSENESRTESRSMLVLTLKRLSHHRPIKLPGMARRLRKWKHGSNLEWSFSANQNGIHLYQKYIRSITPSPTPHPQSPNPYRPLTTTLHPYPFLKFILFEYFITVPWGIFFITDPCGKFWSPYVGKAQQPQEYCYPFL